MPIAIERERSVTPIEDEASCDEHNAESLAPWDQNRVVHMVQVPHLGSKALASNELETFLKPDLATGPYRSKKSTPQTAPVFGHPTAALPYETPLHISNGPKTASQPPAFIKTPSPPPDTLARISKPPSITQTSQETTGRPTAPKIGLQGTMAHGEETYKRRKHSAKPSHSSSENFETRGFGKRFKFAMKDIFKREPAEHAELECIGGKHWTEE
ncbi:uncharacterized protein MYCFIDRAFT_211053 [Pseudocercospora fijiensis CIRAD86]|uniref:Uncharacterized protein n=1 Tax=Pseudocercospora fijiensis (strain CIRAD86) TaxID=383855 RepID=M3AKL2_PSEFD|nr:uncharacterized protein MYCFIDRAFT_211053 [Pseudocercospora fijiensis CIRAD86]EME85121.1 hypothetical protein MYCFIDRAFT_211053 [Pseudocercospora fijiensis CIRAD86]